MRAAPYASGYAVSVRSPVEAPPQSEVRFVPAGWLVPLAAAARLALRRGKFGKLGIAALLWSVAPRKLRLVLYGIVGAALVVVLGALAAIALLALQLT
jgi:hypothetical protein